MGAGEAGYNLDSNMFQSQTHTMHAYTYTYCQFGNINSSNTHAIGLLEKGKVPTGNTMKMCKHHTERHQLAGGVKPRTFLLWEGSANHDTIVENCGKTVEIHFWKA